MSRMLPIPGWPGYHADDEGRIFSTIARVHVGGGKFEVRVDGKEATELAQFDRKSVKLEPTPYRSVNLSRAGKRSNRYVHHLVALTFHGPRPDGYEVLHGDRGSTCHAASNLRYGTPEENSKERVLSRGDDWYRARGLPPPWLKSSDEPASPAVEPAHAFSDMIGEE